MIRELLDRYLISAAFLVSVVLATVVTIMRGWA